MRRFGVKDSKEKELFKRMKRLGISENDLEEKFIRSGGPGGQNTNMTSTCVQLKHIPTGIVVTSQRERTQAVNRFLARRELVSRLEDKTPGMKSPGQKKIEKIRKQKNKRKKRARNKLNENDK